MIFKLAIDCDNAAFDEGAGDEIARILHALAKRMEGSNIEPDGREHPLFDINGTHVGDYWVERDDA